VSERDTAAEAARPAAARRKLGRGLGALMGDARHEEPVVRLDARSVKAASPATENGAAPRTAPEGDPAPSGLASLPIASIEPHPGQPRRRFEEAALEELAASIAMRGVIQPVIVRPLPAGGYQLVAGERRWRAAQKAQLHEIPAIIRELDEREVTALALIENLQREDLNPVEEARAYHRLAEQEGMTQAEIAQLVDKSRSHVANLQRLLALPDEVLDHLEAGRLDMGHARALIGHDSAGAIARMAVEKSLSVREVERLARKPATPRAPQRRAREPRDLEAEADIAAVEKQLEEFLGLSVKIASDADPRSGSLTVKYRTLDQLDLICQRLSGRGI
jgi:ParB family chromosome partitioning protein